MIVGQEMISQGGETNEQEAGRRNCGSEAEQEEEKRDEEVELHLDGERPGVGEEIASLLQLKGGEVG